MLKRFLKTPNARWTSLITIVEQQREHPTHTHTWRPTLVGWRPLHTHLRRLRSPFCQGLERQKSVPPTLPSLEGTEHHPTLRRQLSRSSLGWLVGRNMLSRRFKHGNRFAPWSVWFLSRRSATLVWGFLWKAPGQSLSGIYDFEIYRDPLLPNLCEYSGSFTSPKTHQPKNNHDMSDSSLILHQCKWAQRCSKTEYIDIKTCLIKGWQQSQEHRSPVPGLSDPFWRTTSPRPDEVLPSHIKVRACSRWLRMLRRAEAEA